MQSSPDAEPSPIGNGTPDRPSRGPGARDGRSFVRFRPVCRLAPASRIGDRLSRFRICRQRSAVG